MGMPGKLTSAPAKNQLRWRAGCPRAHQRALALHSGQDLLPGIVVHALKSHRQRLIEVDCLVEEIDRALRFALLQSLLAKTRAERQHLESPKVPSAARDHEFHRAEMHIR